MYAKLGDIKFETLVGFDALNDTRASSYAQHELIEGTPKLQRTGNALQQLSISATFHVHFCNPEVQYDQLNQARERGDILTLVYGTGYIEGDFVITEISRRVVQTDDKGNYVCIVCDIALLEFKTDKAQVEQERALANAFAVDANRPLPINASDAPKSPASATSAAISDAKKQAGFFEVQKDRMKKAQELGSTLIEQAQNFRDKCQVTQSILTGYISKINTRLAFIQNALNVYDIETLCPDLQAQVTACNATTAQANVIIGNYVSFPAVINTSIQAASVLSSAQDTYDISDRMKADFAKLEDSSQGLAASISSRKPLET